MSPGVFRPQSRKRPQHAQAGRAVGRRKSRPAAAPLASRSRHRPATSSGSRFPFQIRLSVDRDAAPAPAPARNRAAAAARSSASGDPVTIAMRRCPIATDESTPSPPRTHPPPKRESTGSRSGMRSRQTSRMPADMIREICASGVGAAAITSRMPSTRCERSSESSSFCRSRVVVGIDRDQRVVPLARRRLGAADDLREVRDRHVGHDDPERPRLAGLQAAGDVVRMIVELADGGLHLPAQQLADRHRSR